MRRQYRCHLNIYGVREIEVCSGSSVHTKSNDAAGENVACCSAVEMRRQDLSSMLEPVLVAINRHVVLCFVHLGVARGCDVVGALGASQNTFGPIGRACRYRNILRCAFDDACAAWKGSGDYSKY